MDVVEMRDGLALPVEALQLAWQLEMQGLALLESPPGTLRVSTADGSVPQLLDSQRSAITHWKTHLLAIVAFTAKCEAANGPYRTKFSKKA